MRLHAFQVKNYKTIQDSGRVEIDKNVSCLLGKNESGKSAVLQALWKFNNVAGAKYDRLFDLPAEDYTRLRSTDPEVVTLEFNFDESDKADFLATFKALTSAPDTVRVRSTYNGVRSYDFEFSYVPAKYSSIDGTVQGIKGALTALVSTTTDADALAKITTAKESLETLSTAGTPDKSAQEIGSEIIQAASVALQAVGKDKLGALEPTLTKALKTFSAHSETKDLKTKVEAWIESRLPIFIYFEDYGRLKTRINLADFITKHQQQQAGSLKDPEEQMLIRTQSALFEWAKLDPAELQNLGKPKQNGETQEQVDRRKAERHRILESASYHLSGDWVDWWDQRTHTLKIHADGDELELRVSDSVNPWEIPFGERSRGFQWFFSFYLTFLVESAKAHRGAIVLLDEPGLHLHPKAQLKLLAFFQKIAEKNQLLYSSHSMFMVDHNHVDNVRTVYLKPKDPLNAKSRAYTRVSGGSEPEGDSETLLPLQGAGAYLLSQTIFLGKRTLIVEGISDYWLLNVLSHFIEENGGEGLHEDTVVLWAGGTSHVLPLATIMASGEQVGPNRMVVMLDSDKQGTDKAKKLIEILAYGQDSVLLLGDIINVARAEGEDIAEFGELISALGQMKMTAAVAPVKNAGETNTEALKRIFQENKWGDLTKETKAKIVLNMTDIWRRGTAAPEPATIERAKQLFKTINEAFDKLHASTATPLRAVAKSA